jgi:hypothetical protein
MNDLNLLRRYEPVIRYTQGEMFFPCSVEGYLARCSLWRQAKGEDPVLILPPGSVNKEVLAIYDLEGRADGLFLRFVDDPLDPIAYQLWRNSKEYPRFDSVGRLARVGFAGRLAESLFDFSLLLRGRVPGGTTGRAWQQYQKMLTEDPRFVYYGRVIRDSSYTILHYLFFYVMNDWRSSFHGVNNHESDWEQIFVYLTGEEGNYMPQWVAFAAHDFSGDDLRRRWDDPELEKVGEDHVVVYAGAGSHAAYVVPGEYLMQVEPEAIKPAKELLRPVRKYVATNLKSGAASTPANLDAPLVSLAFVDYARGDGLSIGPGQEANWSPELLSADLPWVSGYRGLWGLDTGDPIGGERAPAGPKFDRDGSVRHAWRDPLGWAGLDKVPPPDALEALTTAAIVQLQDEAIALWTQIEEKRDALRVSGLTLKALSSTTNLARLAEQQQTALTAASKELQQLSGQHAEILEKRRVLEEYLQRTRQGDQGDPQAHLRHKAVPVPPPPPIAKALDFWAAISGALLVSILILLIAFQPPRWPMWIGLAILLFGAIESALRGKLTNYLLTATAFLAVISAVVLTVTYWRWVIPGALLFIFLYSLLTNVRELRSRRSRSEDEHPTP